jgi:hypothetical protein
VVLQQRVLIQPLGANQHFRLHLPGGVHDFSSLEGSVVYAQRVMPSLLRALAQQAGASQVEIRMTRLDREAPVSAGWGEQIYLGTELVFTAVGRPSPAEGH